MRTYSESKQGIVGPLPESVVARRLLIRPPFGELARRRNLVVDDAATPVCWSDDGELLLAEIIDEGLYCGFFDSENHGGHHNMRNGVATSTEKTGGIYISEGQ